MNQPIMINNLYSYTYTPIENGGVEAYLLYRLSEDYYHIVKTAIYPTILDAEKDFKFYIISNLYTNC
jgi:hypothetical protein